MEQLLCPKCRMEIKSNSDFCNKCGLDLIKINELIRDGDKFLNQEKYQDAITCYEKAIKLGKNNDLAWYGKAKALLKQGENSENVTLCVKCQLCPVLSEAFYEDAIKCYDNAIRINPKFKDAWQGKGMALEKLGRSEDARKCFENSK
ncbi:MAG: Tetratricopeptide repeat protein [Candidatus Methanofastidiosum methylothiophilum]|uniref:Tetratricopeptide repeat protein n=1 Tax=Candidatus Methanofastidiosum methylothiophilum TaxID=1705564 RepID=A0A150IM17_9EURY|nr:MAG: Tetratricopeptide repeat protein [Candidatus Methanofastidiosum methylthiophilus]KYC48607.1 MAG: Tetratricopeptide repeat protein [Candidatus Methanofastidiosum methylthiophilus]KYC51188.1 MAG: Tetratricopeptide repeat protein [Candidatus Methanofastidiosum methylthiophilus]